MGRESEFADLRGRLLDPRARLVTVTGPAGVGKSRLAAAAFEAVSGEFEHGGRYLDLHAVEPAGAGESVLAELFLAAGDTSPRTHQHMINHLRERHYLLALDGCERLLEVLRPLLTALVAACPGLTVLAVSDEPLAMYGESLIRLAPLPVPDLGQRLDLAELERIPTVQLFVHRTRAIRPGFALTAENYEAVAKLCARTDGLPLAVELAAARIKLSSPQALLTGLDDDLDVLSGTRSDTLSRHHSMRSAIEWSLGRLSPEEKTFLACLAPFHDLFDVAAAVGCSRRSPAEVQNFLEKLVDRNVVQLTECQEGAVTFQMLGLVRQHMLDWLRDSGGYHQVMTGHAKYLQEMAAAADTRITGSDQALCLDELRHYCYDIGAVLRFLADTANYAQVIYIGVSLRQFWQICGLTNECVTRMEQGLASTDLPLQLKASAELVLGELLIAMGQYDRAENWLRAAQRGCAGLPECVDMADCRRLLGLIAYHRGDLAEAERLLERSIAAFRAADPDNEPAAADRDLAVCKIALGEYAEAEKLADSAYRTFTARQDRRNAALVQCVIADIAAATEDYERAERCYQEALQVLSAMEDLPGCIACLERLAALFTRRHGRHTESWRRAVRSLGAAAALRGAVECSVPWAAGTDVDTVLAEARERLDAEIFDEAWSAGLAMDLQETTGDALTPMQTLLVVRMQRYGDDNPLTSRELEIAELVALGLTNRKIARRLGIAEWTVVNHLRKIMRKLDCSSRVSVANWMIKLQNGNGLDL
ncbi:LuxR C-terminal-related transcriptional regulator [Microtetraspora sp. NBRC 13810]|uniref:ATP-binding protein n=1 Tax=Microtetraspora sp. NBRC 13810 TaxID=3030990 RepID=UPI0025568433|nr:LuxR C-terminal-related transcriptional regulator [Microtetraspora sp. NBRC 13810]